MDLEKSENFKNLVKFITLKSNNNSLISKIIDYTRKNLKSISNLRYTGESGSGVKTDFNCFVYESQGRILISDDKVTSLLVLVFHYLQSDDVNISKFSSYPPENLFVYITPELVRSYDFIVDKSMIDFCEIYPDLGCTFPKEQIAKAFPELKGADLEFTYRLSNSIGKIQSISNVSKDELKIFRKDSVEQSRASAKILSSSLLSKAENYVDTFLSIGSNELLKSLYDKLLIFADLVTPRIDKTISGDYKSEPIILGALYTLLREFEFKILNFNRQYEFLTKFNERLNGPLSILYNADFKSSVEDVLENKRITSINKFTNLNLQPYFLKRTKIECVASTTHLKLSEPGDTAMCHIFNEYFYKHFGISEFDVVEALVLLFFAFMSTSPYIRQREETFTTSILYEDHPLKITIKSKPFIKYIDSCAKLLPEKDAKRNYIRLFCSYRADYAIQLYKLLGYRPSLYNNCPKILDHLRIDFWKGLNKKLLTKEEQISINILMCLTEYHSRRDESSKLRYYEALGLV
ncbi:60.2 kDa protein [Cordyline virus 3]|uniref:60.2 kDa protein n=1 Tax=Cordyline virus 3 TaxID=1177752 RepID=L7P0H3_9CLOS|nr:60.2 kDa protein [Cordyline virus 3]AFJ05060.2 60.2 kDa protein [Cordyline virus 3]